MFSIFKESTNMINKQIAQVVDSYRRMLANIPKIMFNKQIAEIAKSYRVMLANIPKIEVPRIILPPPNLSRVMFTQMAELNRMNQNLSKAISNLSSSYFTSHETKNLYEIEEPKENPLIERLNECPPGRKNWKVYQNIVRDILEYTLVPPLAPPTEESETETGIQRRDLIFFIPFDTSNFWNWIRITHSSIGVIIDTKSYSDLLPANEIVVNSKYFGEKRLGMFGIIVTRYGLDPSAQKEQVRLWRDEGKMIICLNDEDLKKMIALKEEDENPEIVIDRKIRELRESIE